MTLSHSHGVQFITVSASTSNSDRQSPNITSLIWGFLSPVFNVSLHCFFSMKNFRKSGLSSAHWQLFYLIDVMIEWAMPSQFSQNNFFFYLEQKFSEKTYPKTILLYFMCYSHGTLQSTQALNFCCYWTVHTSYHLPHPLIFL